MKARYFVFEKAEDKTTSVFYQLEDILSTRSELRKYLNARLKDGSGVKGFFIIYGREERITGVKVVAEFETAEN